VGFPLLILSVKRLLKFSTPALAIQLSFSVSFPHFLKRNKFSIYFLRRERRGGGNTEGYNRTTYGRTLVFKRNLGGQTGHTEEYTQVPRMSESMEKKN